jgi:molecular chaperone GrpE
MDDKNRQIDPADQLGTEPEAKMLEESDEVREFKDKIEKLEKEREEYLNGWQRAKADFANYKKEERERFDEVFKYSGKEMMNELITVLDSFDLALATLEKNGPVEKGIYMIRAQFGDVLKRRGLEKIVCKPGDKFDPSVHEAIAEIDSELPAGSVVNEIEAGYRLFEKVLRATRVTVSKDKTNN